MQFSAKSLQNKRKRIKKHRHLQSHFHVILIYMNVNEEFCVFYYQGISLGFDFQQADEFLEAARGIAYTAAQAARERLIQYCTVHQQNDITVREMNGGRPPNGGVEASCAGRIEIEDQFSLCNAHGTCLPDGMHTCSGLFTVKPLILRHPEQVLARPFGLMRWSNWNNFKPFCERRTCYHGATKPH